MTRSGYHIITLSALSRIIFLKKKKSFSHLINLNKIDVYFNWDILGINFKNHSLKMISENSLLNSGVIYTLIF